MIRAAHFDQKIKQPDTLLASLDVVQFHDPDFPGCLRIWTFPLTRVLVCSYELLDDNVSHLTEKRLGPGSLVNDVS